MNETERTKMTEAVAYIRRTLNSEDALTAWLYHDVGILCRELNFFFDLNDARDRLWCYLEDPVEEYRDLYDAYGSAAYDKARDETAEDPALLKALASAYWDRKSPDRSEDEAWIKAFDSEAEHILKRFRRNLYNDNRETCLSFLQDELQNSLCEFMSNDYASALASNEEFSEAVLGDLLATTGMYAGEPYNEDDIRLAVGRVLLRKYGMDC